MNTLFKFILSIVAPFIAGAIGNIATIPNIPTWYAALDKPWFNPPNEVFGPVWSVLYLLMGISLYLVWTAKGENKKAAFVTFGVQLVLNALWSTVFFGLHQPWAAVAVIVLLISAIIVTIREFWRFSRPAAWLLTPYLLWVSFATILNIGVAVLN